MAQNNTPLSLETALNVSNDLVRTIAPYCINVAIAGSVRRNKPEVNDIEIVATPRWIEEPDPSDLFGGNLRVNALYRDWANNLSATGETSRFSESPFGKARPEFAPVKWIKTGTIERIPWEIDPNGKYWRGYMQGPRCNLDLFLTTPENFGAQLLIRTGSREFGTSVMVHAHRVGFEFDDGYLWDARDRPRGPRVMVPTLTEADVFRALNLRYVAPEERTSQDAVVLGWEGSPDA